MKIGHIHAGGSKSRCYSETKLVAGEIGNTGFRAVFPQTLIEGVVIQLAAMTATGDSGQGHGTNGSPQVTIEEQIYPSQASINESSNIPDTRPMYNPSPKHVPGSGWGSNNPIKTQEEGQQLLESGYHHGKQVYNVTDGGVIVKFQPDNTPQNGYHSYEVSKPRDIPSNVLKQMLEDGKISKTAYNRFRKGKK